MTYSSHTTGPRSRPRPAPAEQGPIYTRDVDRRFLRKAFLALPVAIKALVVSDVRWDRERSGPTGH